MNKIDCIKKGFVLFLYGATATEVVGAIFHFIG